MREYMDRGRIDNRRVCKREIETRRKILVSIFLYTYRYKWMNESGIMAALSMIILSACNNTGKQDGVMEQADGSKSLFGFLDRNYFNR